MAAAGSGAPMLKGRRPRQSRGPRHDQASGDPAAPSGHVLGRPPYCTPGPTGHRRSPTLLPHRRGGHRAGRICSTSVHRSPSGRSATSSWSWPRTGEGPSSWGPSRRRSNWTPQPLLRFGGDRHGDSHTSKPARRTCPESPVPSPLPRGQGDGTGDGDRAREVGPGGAMLGPGTKPAPPGACGSRLTGATGPR